MMQVSVLNRIASSLRGDDKVKDYVNGHLGPRLIEESGLSCRIEKSYGEGWVVTLYDDDGPVTTVSNPSFWYATVQAYVLFRGGEQDISKLTAEEINRQVAAYRKTPTRGFNYVSGESNLTANLVGAMTNGGCDVQLFRQCLAVTKGDKTLEVPYLNPNRAICEAYLAYKRGGLGFGADSSDNYQKVYKFQFEDGTEYEINSEHIKRVKGAGGE